MPENEAAIHKAEAACENLYYTKKGLHYWQDCIQGVNRMRRVLRRGVSVASAEKAALKICDNKEEHLGPRGRCRVGVRKLARALKR